MGEKLEPFYNVGPGDIIKDAMLELGWNQSDLSEIMGRSLKCVNQILNNKQCITPETAELLGKIFSTSAEMWLNLDAKYQLRKLEKTDSGKRDIAEYKAQMRRIMPVSEIKNKGWFANDVSTVEGIKNECLRIFNSDVPSINECDSYTKKFCARQTRFNFEYTPVYCYTWFEYAKHFAKEISLPKYNLKRLNDIAQKLGSYTLLENGVQKVISDLNDCGVGFFVLSHLQKTYLDGAAFVLGKNPFIVYTARYDRVDNFWFVLAHEIAHVLLHFAYLKQPCLDNMKEKAETEREKEADKKASELLNSEKIIAAGNEYKQYFTESRLKKISSDVQVSVPVVLGILQYARVIDWKKFSKCRQPVKNMIPPEWIKG